MLSITEISSHGLQTELHRGDLIKFAIGEGGLVFVDSKLEKADLQYLGKSNRARAFADSYSKVRWWIQIACPMLELLIQLPV